MANISFGERFRRARMRNNLSQDDMAGKLGVTQPTISNWESGKIMPTKQQKLKVREVLDGLDPDSKPNSDGPTAPEGQSPLSFWLAQSRTEAKMSVPELAKRAGVSAPAIYNIESGKILNPRQGTIQALEKALGQRFSEDAKDTLRDDARIEGLGELIDFDPHSDNDRPTVAGIYVLYDISQRPIYVGQGVNIRSRIKDHQDKFWFREPIVETGAFVEIADKNLREKTETLLIRFLKSNAVINKQKVDRE